MSSALSKQDLCAKFQIPPRDLRKLDSTVPTVVPTILSRKGCIILTILHLRVAITAKEVTIFDSIGSEDSWLKGVFVWSLEVRLLLSFPFPFSPPLPSLLPLSRTPKTEPDPLPK
jgi:hypothetical protein